MQENSKQCELCGVEMEYSYKHHLVPRQKSKKLVREIKHAVINCCLPCSKQVHALFTNNEMKREFNTLEKLKANPRVQKWILWRVKHPSVADISYTGK